MYGLRSSFQSLIDIEDCDTERYELHIFISLGLWYVRKGFSRDGSFRALNPICRPYEPFIVVCRPWYMCCFSKRGLGTILEKEK